MPDGNAVADLEFEHALCRHTGWNPLWAKPYVVDADKELVEQIGGSDMVRRQHYICRRVLRAPGTRTPPPPWQTPTSTDA